MPYLGGETRMPTPAIAAEQVEAWLLTRAEFEGVVLAEDEVAGLCTRIVEAHAAIDRVWRYDLTAIDLAVQLFLGDAPR